MIWKENYLDLKLSKHGRSHYNKSHNQEIGQIKITH